MLRNKVGIKKILCGNGLVLLIPFVEYRNECGNVNRGFNEHATSPNKDPGS